MLQAVEVDSMPVAAEANGVPGEDPGLPDQLGDEAEANKPDGKYALGAIWH